MKGTIRPALGGRFLIHENSCSLQGRPFYGLSILGYDLATNKWQAAWVDSFHMSTAIMFSEGDPDGKFSVLGHYFAGENEPPWGWRTEIDLVDDNNIVITAFNIMPSGDEARATETRYTRNS